MTFPQRNPLRPAPGRDLCWRGDRRGAHLPGCDHPRHGGDPARGDSCGRRAAVSGFFAALFYLDAIGYIGLTAALYYPAFARFRRLTRWALIALTAATIVAYFALIQGQYDAMGIADKIAEVVLIVLLVIEGRRDRQPLSSRAPERPEPPSRQRA